MKRIFRYFSPRFLVLAGANLLLDILLCLVLMVTFGAGALAASLLFISAFFGDRFCDLLGPKVALWCRLQGIEPSGSARPNPLKKTPGVEP